MEQNQSEHVVDLVEEEDETVDLVSGDDSPRDRSSAKRGRVMDDTDKLKPIKEFLKCSICIEIFHKPVMIAPCSHVFCGGCLGTWLLSTPEPCCPECRSKVRHVLDAPKNIESMIEFYLKEYPEEKRDQASIRKMDMQDDVKKLIFTDIAFRGAHSPVPQARHNANRSFSQYHQGFTWV